MDYLEKGPLLILADIFSIVTILSCLVVKVPQIKIIKENQSAIGISLVGLTLELCSYTVMMCYNYANGYLFLSYLEYPILLVQEYVLILMVLKYSDLLNTKSYIGAGIYVGVLGGFLSKALPKSILFTLVPFCTPVGAASKIMQLISIIRSKDSQSVSLTTWGLSAFTNLTRVYTILVDSGDMMLLANFTISVLLSSSVLGAAWFYKKPKIN